MQDLVTEADSVINKVVCFHIPFTHRVIAQVLMGCIHQGFLGIKTAMRIHVDKAIGGGFRKPLVAPGPSAEEELRAGLQRVFDVEVSL